LRSNDLDMTEELDAAFQAARETMEKALAHLEHELVKLRTGKASPDLVRDIVVDYYGAPTPISSIASITTPDSRTIAIQPWERKIISAIERALINSNLGMMPGNDGEVIRLMVPPLTEERRKELIKKGKTYTEDARVGIRNARHKYIDQVKKSVKDGLAEDMGKRKEADIQTLVNEYIVRAEKVTELKEKEMLTV
jgi:ribosome recycling factor